MLSVKGAPVKSTVQYIVSKLEDRLPPFTAQLPPGIKEWFSSPILATKNYSAEDLARLMEAYAATIGGDPEAVYMEMGRASADYSLNTIHRMFLAIGTPEMMVPRGAAAWNSYYDQGTMKATTEGPGTAMMQLSGVRLPHRAICMRITGWMEKFVDLASGKKATILHTQCTLQGGALEEWTGRW
jgi:hypothetical protein